MVTPVAKRLDSAFKVSITSMDSPQSALGKTSRDIRRRARSLWVVTVRLQARPGSEERARTEEPVDRIMKWNEKEIEDDYRAQGGSQGIWLPGFCSPENSVDAQERKLRAKERDRSKWVRSQGDR